MTQKNRNLYQRIAAVMQAVKYIRKDARVSAGRETYMAVSHDAVIAKLRGPMLDAGIVSTITQKGPGIIFEGQTRGGSAKIRFQAVYEIAYVNIDDPQDRLVIDMEAHAEDMGDKAPGKAASYAVKTAHLKTFSLESGDQEEQREEYAPVAPAQPVKVIDMTETYTKASEFLGMEYAEILDHARDAIAASTGGEIPGDVTKLSEPLAVIARITLREMGKAMQPDRKAESVADKRRRHINAKIGELKLEREMVKKGLKALFGIDSTSQCAALTDGEWKNVIDDLPGVAAAGEAAAAEEVEKTAD